MDGGNDRPVFVHTHLQLWESLHGDAALAGARSRLRLYTTHTQTQEDRGWVGRLARQLARRRADAGQRSTNFDDTAEAGATLAGDAVTTGGGGGVHDTGAQGRHKARRLIFAHRLGQSWRHTDTTHAAAVNAPLAAHAACGHARGHLSAHEAAAVQWQPYTRLSLACRIERPICAT